MSVSSGVVSQTPHPQRASFDVWFIVASICPKVAHLHTHMYPSTSTGHVANTSGDTNTHTYQHNGAFCGRPYTTLYCTYRVIRNTANILLINIFVRYSTRFVYQRHARVPYLPSRAHSDLILRLEAVHHLTVRLVEVFEQWFISSRTQLSKQLQSLPQNPSLNA